MVEEGNVTAFSLVFSCSGRVKYRQSGEFEQNEMVLMMSHLISIYWCVCVCVCRQVLWNAGKIQAS